MTASEGQVADVVARWLPAFLAGRRADAELYADEVVTWHAATETTTPLGDAPSGARLRAAVPDLHHDNVRVHVHASGFVVQATVAGTVAGEAVRVHTALVVTVVDGRITRFEEYLDRQQAAPFAALLSAG